MSNATLYFELARSEEKAGNECAALLFYLSSFCDSFNSGTQGLPLWYRCKNPDAAEPALIAGSVFIRPDALIRSFIGCRVPEIIIRFH